MCRQTCDNICIFVQLFDTDNPVNQNSDRYMFTTEGHILPLAPWLRQHNWDSAHFTLPPNPAINSTDLHANVSYIQHGKLIEYTLLK